MAIGIFFLLVNLPCRQFEMENIWLDEVDFGSRNFVRLSCPSTCHVTCFAHALVKARRFGKNE